MTDVVSLLFVDILLSKAKVTLFLDGNCSVIASAVSEYYFCQMLFRVLADSSTKLLCNVLYDPDSLWLDIEFHAI